MRRGIFSNKKGFTLVEIILSIAIIGIMAVSFIPVFTAGFKGVIFAGEKKTEMFDTQNVMEQEVADSANSGTETLTVTFPADGGKPEFPVTVDGETVNDGSYILFKAKMN